MNNQEIDKGIYRNLFFRIFAAAIGYLKDHLVGEIKHRKLGAVEDMMYWVVSVPAIWNDSCKQFMRESAEMVIFYIILI
jgi:hypothetical protein